MFIRIKHTQINHWKPVFIINYFLLINNTIQYNIRFLLNEYCIVLLINFTLEEWHSYKSDIYGMNILETSISE